MDRLRELEIFVAVVEAGSLAAAGRRLNLSPPAVTRAIASLEDRLSARLLTRTTRRLSLTEAGQRFVEHARRLLAEFKAAEADIAGHAATPGGHLKLTASVTFGRLALMPVLGDFLAAHPRITASAVLLDRVVDLVEEGMDGGVRFGALPDSNLVAKRIGSVRRILAASPDYLAGRGKPRHPDDLGLHGLIGFTGLMTGTTLALHAGGQTIRQKVRPQLEVNDAMAALAAAEQGHGIAYLYCYMAGESIRAGRLQPVLQSYWPPAEPVSIVYPDSGLLAAKMRAFVDWAAPRLGERLVALSARE